MKDDNYHLASNLSKKSARSVSQGAASPRTQDTKHRANHSDAVLFLSIHTHTHRANHSIARVRVKEQTIKIVTNRIVTLANTTSSATNMLLKFPQMCETV